MLIDEVLVAYLSNEPGMAGLVGTRIYPLVIPEKKKLPAIAYQQISAPREYTHSGQEDMVSARFQFTVQAASFPQIRATVIALRRALSGYRGPMGGASGISVEGSYLENEIDGWSEATGKFTRRLDFILQYHEV